MKTTFEMSDPLFKSAKEFPERSQMTPQALVDKGLLSVMSDLRVKDKSAFKLQKASVGGTAVLKLARADWQVLEEQHVCDRIFAQKARC